MNINLCTLILVIALTSDLCLATFPKPPLTPGAHNVTGQSNSVPKKGSRSGFDPNYGLWSSNQWNRFDVMQLLPILLILGLGIMLLPIITSCLTTLFSPLGMGGIGGIGNSPYFPHGRKKRESDAELPSMTDMVLNLLVNLEKAIEKYGKE